MVICLERDADLHTAQLMPLPLTVSRFSKIQIFLPFWYRLTRVVPEKGPLNGCVCVCVCVCHLQAHCQESGSLVEYGLPLPLPCSLCRAAIERAFRVWSDVSPLTFTEVSSASDADFKLEFVAGEHRDGPQNAFDGPGMRTTITQLVVGLV